LDKYADITRHIVYNVEIKILSL